MRIRNLKTKAIAAVLFLIPMACMHSFDGHHSGSHPSISSQPFYKDGNCDPLSGWVMEQGIAPLYQESPGSREG